MNWSSRKQMVVTRSNMEAEYKTIASTLEETKVVRALLMELGVIVELPMRILRDNQGATFIANNPVCHSKMKHVAMDFHFVKDKAERGIIGVEHILGTK